MNEMQPVVATEPLPLGVKQVVSAGKASGVIAEGGVVYTFGGGERYTLGDGSQERSLAPLPVDSEVVALSATAVNMIDIH
ncbi:MAG TPA: hypothetical protein VMB91_06735 [Solirubrobacteraceae bacterium]|nr:hypothetical protein [Solirubrobacteraceae bacterium]